MIGWDVDGACLAAGMVAREGSFQYGEGTWAEVGVSQEVGSWEICRR